MTQWVVLSFQLLFWGWRVWISIECLLEKINGTNIPGSKPVIVVQRKDNRVSEISSGHENTQAVFKTNLVKKILN